MGFFKLISREFDYGRERTVACEYMPPHPRLAAHQPLHRAERWWRENTLQYFTTINMYSILIYA